MKQIIGIVCYAIGIIVGIAIYEELKKRFGSDFYVKAYDSIKARLSKQEAEEVQS